MDHQPRRLPVFEPVKHSSVLEPILEECSPLYHWNAMDADKGTPIACENLGYEGRAAAIGKGTGLEFRFGSCPTDSIEIEVRLLPNHPVTDDGRLRFPLLWTTVLHKWFLIIPKGVARNGKKMYWAIRLSKR